MDNLYAFYGVYKSCRNAAWRCCIDFGIDRMPVKVLDLARRMGIRVVRDSDVHELRADESGASIYFRDHWIIVYDDSLPPAESRMVLAHELGHILLGHSYKYAKRRFENEKDTKQMSESEADLFAVRLLAPACVLHELHVLDSDGIASLCEIPKKVASKRARRMAILEKRQRYYNDPLERETVACFTDFIREYRDQ